MDNQKSNYEWLGDDKIDNLKNIKAPLPENEYSKSYKEPDFEFDKQLRVDEQYISSLPDLQNGHAALIQGAPVAIQQVGIHNFRLPLRYSRKNNPIPLELETSVTGTVSLEAHKKGINMSRIMRTFYEYKDEVFTLETVRQILNSYKEKLGSFEARIMMKFSYPIIQKSLRSGLEGYQYYDVCFEVDMDKDGNTKEILHFDFVYSSACPCSFELAEHARKYRNKATVSHSQRSVMRVSIDCAKMIWIEDLKDLCLEALQTETQVMVKREDEQAFAELNGSYLKFVEDAVRLVYKSLSNNPDIKDFKIIASHNESLHSHNAIAVITKGIPGGFDHTVSREDYNVLGSR